MCLCAYQIEALEAYKDIICYKVVDENYKSPCFGELYEIGKIKKSSLISSFRYVEEGLHTYSKLDYISALNLTPNSWTKYNEFASGNGSKILKCIIPKGSHYYFNIEEYCSDTLLPIEEIEFTTHQHYVYEKKNSKEGF